MGELLIQRTPQLIAAEIRHIHLETQRIVLNNAIEIGRRLMEAKSLLPHGEWTGWLLDSVEYSQSTANNFMKIFQEYGADQITMLEERNTKHPIYDRLTYSKAIALMAIPEEERPEYIETHPIDDLSVRELKEAIRSKEESEDRAKGAEQQAAAFQKKIDDLVLKNLDLKATASKVDEAVKKAVEKEKSDAEKKLKSLESEVKKLEKALEEVQAKQEEENDDADPEEEKNKIRSELQEQLKLEIEKEKGRLQIEIETAKNMVKERDKQIKELQLKVATGANEDIQVFKVLYEQTAEGFKKLINQVGKIKEVDPAGAMKYLGALEKTLGIMMENVNKTKWW